MTGPLVAKELSGISRRWQTYAARTFFVGVLALVLHRFWQEAAGRSLSESAELGRQLFAPYVALQAFFTLTAAIVSASDQFSREFRQGTMSILQLTPLSARDIAFAKWKAVLVQTGALVLAGLPIAAICLYLGGIGLLDVVGSAVAAFSLGALGSGLTLFFAARFRSAYAAMIAAAGTLVGITSLLAMPALTDEPLFFYPVVFTHPAFAAMALAHPILTHPGLTWGWMTASLLAFGMAHLLMQHAGLRLERRLAEADDPWLHRREQRAIEIAAYHEAHGTRPVRVLSSRRVVWDEAPLLWKEITTRPYLKLREEWRKRLLVGLFGLVGLAWLLSGWGRETFLLHGLATLFLLLAVLQGVMLFAPERTDRNADLLLSSPVSTGAIVRSKLLAGIIVPEALAALFLWGFMILLWSWDTGLDGLLFLYSCGGLLLALAFLLGAHASLASRTTRGAVVLAIGTLSLLLIAVPWLCEFLSPSGYSRRSLTGVARVISLLTRPSALLSVAQHDESISPLDFFMIYGPAYGTTIVLLAGALLHRFDRAVRRQEAR